MCPKGGQMILPPLEFLPWGSVSFCPGLHASTIASPAPPNPQKVMYPFLAALSLSHPHWYNPILLLSRFSACPAPEFTWAWTQSDSWPLLEWNRYCGIKWRQIADRAWWAAPDIQRQTTGLMAQFLGSSRGSTGNQNCQPESLWAQLTQ